MRRGSTERQATIGWFVFATLLLTLGTPPPAAALDLTGVYVIVSPIPCRITLTQTGTDLHQTGSCFGTLPFSASGTVDPVTGDFSVNGELTGACSNLVIIGMGDGEAFTGTYTSTGCGSGILSGTKCSNGVLDPQENCEDGNAMDGDCCSARCRLDPAGTACTSDRQSCTDDVCDASGTCTHVPITGPCEDGNACTIGGVCIGGACVPGSPAPAGQACTDDFDPCTADVCDAAGTCTHVPVPPEVCRRALTCHSTCTQQLKECRQTCPRRGPARRDCRAACAARSTCTAPGAPIRTLAYVMTECRTDTQGVLSGGQRLVIRRGNCDPVTVPLFPLAPSGPCVLGGADELMVGVFQRAAVLPDGSGVVFEVTNEFSLLPSIKNLELPDKGIFFVRADGRGLRKLGEPSRAWALASVGGVPMTDLFVIAVSPNGRTVAFSDLGPGPDGQETDQIFTLDIATGHPKQLTHRQATNENVPPRLSCLSFLDNRTITFCNRVYNPAIPGFLITDVFIVRTDGTPEEKVPVVSLPGGGVVPVFTIFGSRTRAAVTVVFYPAMPTDHFLIHPLIIEELFLLDGPGFLQLTKFHRGDTARAGRGGALAGQRVFFEASANFGANPDEYCQIFSVNTLGTELRQLTHLRDRASPSTSGCFDASPGSCSIDRYFADRLSGTVVFTSSCDPVGENPFGYEEAFGMRPDGSGLRQLTAAPGLETDPDGAVHVEIPGPFYYQ